MVCADMLGQQLMDDGGTASRSNRAENTGVHV
jgi:hypothetical protein